jgi:hypothetical protein
MIKLVEILNRIDSENEKGLINIEDWRFPDVDHLSNMGFEFKDDFRLQTPQEPKITVYKKKDMDETNGQPHDFFFVEEKDRKNKRFKTFNDVMDYFDIYVQPYYDKHR